VVQFDGTVGKITGYAGANGYFVSATAGGQGLQDVGILGIDSGNVGAQAKGAGSVAAQTKVTLLCPGPVFRHDSPEV
jgi:hypothetical protein